jgi:peptide/nickel transport system permease protein
VLVIAITSWGTAARLIRSQTLSVRNRNYVERARALGASNWHIITRHVLPNVFPIIFAQTILMVSLAILSETTLSLIGLGDPTQPSWGGVIEQAFSAGATTLGAWWWLFFPGMGITTTVLAFAMIGFALDEILDPRLRDR